jgi:ABC-type transport system involved in cytochrome bd biosynthesis fused ATPase/permease subunit
VIRLNEKRPLQGRITHARRHFLPSVMTRRVAPMLVIFAVLFINLCIYNIYLGTVTIQQLIKNVKVKCQNLTVKVMKHYSECETLYGESYEFDTK